MVPETLAARADAVRDGPRGAASASFAIGAARYADSGFTRAVLRGAEYRGAQHRSPSRFAEAARDPRPRAAGARLPLRARARQGRARARLGVRPSGDGRSRRSTRELAAFATGLPRGTGLLVTADHGVVDVPAHRHTSSTRAPELLDGVRQSAGEPRCLQLYLEPGCRRRRPCRTRRAVAGGRGTSARGCCRATRRSRRALRRRRPRGASVASATCSSRRARASPTTTVARPIARPRPMIGQHGSMTDEEVRIPLVRAGAYERA